MQKKCIAYFLVLEIGNGSDSVRLPAMDLPYSPKHYRLQLNRAETALGLYELIVLCHFSVDAQTSPTLYPSLPHLSAMSPHSVHQHRWSHRRTPKQQSSSILSTNYWNL